MSNRPGVILYFELRDQLQFCSDEELGQLLRAILDYGATGVLPEFSDRAMQMLWYGLQSKIDHDGIRYEATRRARSLGGHNKHAVERGEPKLTMEEYEQVRIRREMEKLKEEATSDKW